VLGAVMMLAGGDDLKSEVPPAVAARDLAHAGGFDFVEVAGATHMMVLERPRFVAELTRAFVRANHAI
jgi:pimeloyl-ACP methyl ester carboxylesterase